MRIFYTQPVGMSLQTNTSKRHDGFPYRKAGLFSCALGAWSEDNTLCKEWSWRAAFNETENNTTFGRKAYIIFFFAFFNRGSGPLNARPQRGLHAFRNHANCACQLFCWPRGLAVVSPGFIQASVRPHASM